MPAEDLNVQTPGNAPTSNEQQPDGSAAPATDDGSAALIAAHEATIAQQAALIS